MNKSILLLVLVAAIIGGGLWYFKFRPTAGEGYQAVFLSNGQVYFGKITETSSSYLTLDDVHYLIAQSPLQDQQGATPSAQPQYTLRKLGSELHGPEGKMIINRKHILFMEELKTDGKVVEAIVAAAQQLEEQPAE